MKQDFPKIRAACPVSCRCQAGLGKNIGHAGAKVTFMTPALAENRARHKLFWRDYDLIMLDEVHKTATSALYANLARRIVLDVVDNKSSIGHKALVFASATLSEAVIPYRDRFSWEEFCL